MALRSYLIHFMLIVLGLTGLGAAWAAIRDGDEDSLRVIETGVSCAIATAVILPFSTRADRIGSRLEGLAGMTFIMLMFATSLALIWGLFERIGNSDLEWKVWWTLLWVAATCLPAALKIRLLQSNAHWIAGVFGIALSMTVLILFLLGTWHPKNDDFDNVFIRSGLVISATGLVATLAMFGAGVRPRRYWRWIGVVAAATACTRILLEIWRENYNDATEWVQVAALCLAAAIAHLVVCLLIPLTPLQRWIRIVTCLSAFTAAASVATMSWAKAHDKTWSNLDRSTAAAGILACCGTLSLLVLARFNRGLDRKPVLTQIREMTLVCPGCRSHENGFIGQVGLFLLRTAAERRRRGTTLSAM